MGHVKVVIGQLGAALELHGVNDNPITLLLLSPTRLEHYRRIMAEDNPDMLHACIGQVAMFAAKRLCHGNVDPHIWSYNASEDKYSVA
jgi:hypothetical protein